MIISLSLPTCTFVSIFTDVVKCVSIRSICGTTGMGVDNIGLIFPFFIPNNYISRAKFLLLVSVLLWADIYT